MVITTAQLHSSKPELRFCTGSNPARGVSEIRDGEDLGQWSRLEISQRLSSVNYSTKTIHHHHQWERANEYFRDHLHHSNKVKDVNKEINHMQNKIYEYFSETHGHVKDKEINEYENWTKNQLKNHLKLLKSQNPKPAEEIKRVSHVLRKRYKQRSDTDFDHQTEFYKSYWKYCEKVFEPQSQKITPTFNETECKQYFRKILSEKNRHKTFNPPSWMKKLNEPTMNSAIICRNY